TWPARAASTRSGSRRCDLCPTPAARRPVVAPRRGGQRLAEGAGAGRPGGELLVRRVGDVVEREALGRAQRRGAYAVAPRRFPGAGGEHLGRPGLVPSALPHSEQRADEGADHVVAEGVGDDGRDDQALVGPALPGALPPQLAQLPNGGRALAGAAVGEEVVLAEQRGARPRHRLDVQRPTVAQHVPAQRVVGGGPVRDPVAVAAPLRPEAGVEVVRDLAGDVDDDILGQYTGQAADERLRGG